MTLLPEAAPAFDWELELAAELDPAELVWAELAGAELAGAELVAAEPPADGLAVAEPPADGLAPPVLEDATPSFTFAPN